MTAKTPSRAVLKRAPATARSTTASIGRTSAITCSDLRLRIAPDTEVAESLGAPRRANHQRQAIETGTWSNGL
jgi:hypothetical protein